MPGYAYLYVREEGMYSRLLVSAIVFLRRNTYIYNMIPITLHISFLFSLFIQTIL
jgi:hypothetical protein